MSHLLFALLIVPAQLAAPIANRQSADATDATDAVVLYHCGFEADQDLNYDAWPDGWRRRLGRGLPHYVGCKIKPDSDRAGQRCFRFDLDGGGAVAYSPAVEVSAEYTYWIEAQARTEGLRHSQAFVSLRFLDKKQRPTTAHESKKLGGSVGWTPLRLGPIVTDDPHVKFASVGLHLMPGEAADLTGSASFDDVKIVRRPRLTISTGRPWNLFDESDPTEITCRASGFEDPDATLRLEMLDRRGQVVRTHSGWDAGHTTPGQHASVWNPEPREAGYYRVRATLISGGQEIARHETSFAVLASRSQADLGHFGWTLPQGEGKYALPELAELLRNAGIYRVKFPLWHDPADAARRAELVAFLDQLAWHDVLAIGLLHAPPEAARQKLFGKETPRSAAGLFSAPPDQLRAELQPVMLPMALHVRDWQLGDDRDRSFAGDRLATRKIAALRAEFGRSGMNVRLAVPWDRNRPLAEVKLPWQTTAYDSHDPPAHQEAARPHWVSIDRLDPTRRAADLVQRMVAATAGGADGVFFYDPLDPQRGMVDAGGTAGALLVTWRTAAGLLGGSRYRGSLQLPGRSKNHVFQRAGEWLLVTWRPTPRREALYLGDDAREVNLWGEERDLPRDGERQVCQARVLPTFVSGLDPAVTQMRLAASLTPERLPSEPSTRHRVELRVRNYFAQPVAGTVSLATPNNWRVKPSEPVQLDLSQGEATVSWQIRLPYDVELGRHTLRADFRLSAGRPYQFSVYRDVRVGEEDVELDVFTRLDGAGNLVVEQELHNHGTRLVEFDCELFIPNQRRQRITLRELSPGVHRHVYLVPNGKALLGKTLWLRAAQPAGRRAISRKFQAAP